MTLTPVTLVDAGLAHLVALVHLGLAGWVTIHVLLRRSDVPAAIGWIGLAWLSPLIGPALYFLFGINRVKRRAARMKPAGGRRNRTQGHESAQLAQVELRAVAEVARIVTGRALLAGNRIEVLDSAEAAYGAMVAAIESARRSVALGAYIFRADAAGRPFVAALGAAQRRGIEVRVLVDGLGSGYLRAPVVAALRQEGIEAGRFLHDWLPWQMPFLNLRNHKKLLIVDGTEGFVGGLNIGAENLATAPLESRVRDVHFRLRGPAVGHLMASFAEDWWFTRAEELAGELWFSAPEACGPSAARGIDSGPDEDLGTVETILAAAIGQARTAIRVVTPYFLPSARLMSALALAALRGVRVDIVMPERSDHLALDWAVRAHLGFLDPPGVAVHLVPLPFDHAKLATVDGGWCLIGSPNWDTRSLRLNFEFALECYDPALVATLDHLIDQRIAGARRLAPGELASRPIAWKLRDAAARLMLPYL